MLHRPYRSLGSGRDLEIAEIGQFRKIAAAVRTRLGVHIQLTNVKAALRQVMLWSWAGLSIVDGDSVKISSQLEGQSDSRWDNSFLRVCSISQSSLPNSYS
jgi:hypothetical protein